MPEDNVCELTASSTDEDEDQLTHMQRSLAFDLILLLSEPREALPLMKCWLNNSRNQHFAQAHKRETETLESKTRAFLPIVHDIRVQGRTIAIHKQ